MNAEQKREYLFRFHRFQKSREAHFATPIYTALRSQYNFVLSLLEKGYNEHEAVNLIPSEPVTVVLRNIYIDAATIYGAKVRSDLNKLVPRRLQNPNSFNQFKSSRLPLSTGVLTDFNGALDRHHKDIKIKSRLPMGFSEEMRRLIEQYFQLDILNQSEGITETTKELIRKVFTAAYEKGEGIDDIIAQLKDTELSKIRARTIARTETVTAANQGSLFVAKSSGLDLNKEWLSANDNRVRGSKPTDQANHKRMNGRVVGIDDFFNVDGYDMLVPGDRGGKNGQFPVPAKEVVNCRCTTLFIPI